MKLRYRLGLGLALAAMVTSPAMARDPSGTYTRPNGDVVRVWITDNKLYCRIIEGNRPDFEMCHGMEAEGEDWTGGDMKHPGMPGFMTFNGTISSDETSIPIRGCAMGQSLCRSEHWDKVQ